MNTITADITDYEARVAVGRKVENSILAALRQAGVNIVVPTREEDKHQKIDAWIIDTKGDKHSLQIKYRETGDDILFELIRDFKDAAPGRDMLCEAEFYLVVNRKGTARLFYTAPIKAWATKLLELAKKELSVNPAKVSWKGLKPWEMKVTIDRGNKSRKLMAYMSPSMFESVMEWNNLI